jgi:hypothetical protein
MPTCPASSPWIAASLSSLIIATRRWRANSRIAVLTEARVRTRSGDIPAHWPNQRRLAPSDGRKLVSPSIGCVQRREAACSCGQVRVTTEGDPEPISMCQCLACQRRTGSAFGLQARWPKERVEVSGRYTEYSASQTRARSGRSASARCGATVFWTNEAYFPDWIASPSARSPIPRSHIRPSPPSGRRDGIRGCLFRPGSRKSTARTQLCCSVAPRVWAIGVRGHSRTLAQAL